MKDIRGVLQQKEQELQQLTKEIEALRLVMGMLDEDNSRPKMAANGPALAAPTPMYSAADPKGFTPNEVLGGAKREWP